MEVFLNYEENNIKNYYKILKKNNKNSYENIIVFHIGSQSIYQNIIMSIQNIIHHNPDTLLIITIIYNLDLNNIKFQIKNILDHNDIIIANIENKGMDIGGLYIALSIINDEAINYDYLTKFHTKTNKFWLDQMLYPYLNNYNNTISIFKNNSNYLSLNNGATTIPIDNYHISEINKIFMELYNIDLKKQLKKKNYLIKFLKKMGVDNRLIVNKLQDILPCFCAGTISTYKKQLIDKLIISIPIDNYIFFKEGYVIDNGINKSLPHMIERILGYLQYYMGNGSIKFIRCVGNNEEE